MNKAKATHPLAELREALGKTQQQFAEEIGESRSYVEKMEQARKPVSSHIATLLMLLYGCDPASLQKPTGPLKHLLPGPAKLRKLINEWASFFPIAESDTSVMLQRLLLPKLEVLLKAAGSEQRALNLLTQLDEWIGDAAKTLRLGAAIERILKEHAERGEPVEWRPLVLKDDADGSMFSIPVSTVTADLSPGGGVSKEENDSRGIPQVNPDKMTRLLRSIQRD